MRDNYVGDVGDFFKYGLLRHLSGFTAEDGGGALRLGVIWYLYQDPCREGDGQLTSYLAQEKKGRHFRPCDPVLYDTLKSIVIGNSRAVSAVEKSGLFPADTCFYSEPLSYVEVPAAREARLGHRRRWFEGALAATKDADLIFVDPDNGLEVKSISSGYMKAPKFCLFEEVAALWRRDQSLILYQHRDRYRTARMQIDERFAQLRNLLPGVALDALEFPGRIFFVLMAPGHAPRLKERISSLRQRFARHTGNARPFKPGPGKDADCKVKAYSSCPHAILCWGMKRILYIACGALGREVTALIEANGWQGRAQVTCLPAHLHNRPERIVPALRRKIRAAKATASYDKIFVLYGDCGTGGELDRCLAEEGIERIQGAHCYEFYAGRDNFAALMEEEIGSFFVTDYLVRHFDRLIVAGLGLDRHPSLRTLYFGNYRRLVYLAQTEDAVLAEKARACAEKLALIYERRFTGYGGLAPALASSPSGAWLS